MTRPKHVPMPRPPVTMERPPISPPGPRPPPTRIPGPGVPRVTPRRPFLWRGDSESAGDPSVVELATAIPEHLEGGFACDHAPECSRRHALPIAVARFKR